MGRKSEFQLDTPIVDDFLTFNNKKYCFVYIRKVFVTNVLLLLFIYGLLMCLFSASGMAAANILAEKGLRTPNTDDFEVVDAFNIEKTMRAGE